MKRQEKVLYGGLLGQFHRVPVAIHEVLQCAKQQNPHLHTSSLSPVRGLLESQRVAGVNRRQRTA